MNQFLISEWVDSTLISPEIKCCMSQGFINRQYHTHIAWIAVLTFTIMHGTSPDYWKENSRYNLQSNNGLLLEILPIKPKKKLGDRSFQMAAPTVWNKLPINIRNETNFYIYIY